MRVGEIPTEAVLVQDSQDRLAVLESIGKELLREYPTLFVLTGDGEVKRVWGVRRFIPYLEEEAEEVWP